MLTVILATGHSRRFRDVGFPLTKPMLPMPDDRTLLEWQIDTMKPERLLYVSRKEHQSFEYNTIFKLLKQDGLKDLFHIWIDEETKGPLDAMWRLRGFLKKDEPIAVLYCDTLPLFHIDTRVDEDVAMIAGQKTSDLRFTEIPSTNLKAMGLFAFGNGRKMVDNMKRKPRGEENGLPDIVYAYSGRWIPVEFSKKKLVDLGTPQAYRMWMGEQGAPVGEW